MCPGNGQRRTSMTAWSGSRTWTWNCSAYGMAMWRDIRYGLRTMMQWPLSTIVAVLALAFGIGVNVTSFVSVNALILHPFPFPKLDRIVSVSEGERKDADAREAVAPANFKDWRSASGSFDEIGVYQRWTASLTGSKELGSVEAARVSPEFFKVLGAAALKGRALLSDDVKDARTAVVSEGFWRSHFAAAGDLTGRQVSLNGQQYTVVGVMPRGFDFPLSCEIWTPLRMSAEEDRQRASRSLEILALLKPGVTAQQAQSEAQGIAQQWETQYPETNRGRTLRVTPILETADRVTERFVLMLMAASTMVLLLACANVMNLQLARAARREKEIAVRAALGASRFQIARQLMAEGVLMALLGGVLALFLASWNLDLNKARIPAVAFAEVAGLRSMQIDGRVVVYTLCISIIAGLVASMPAIIRLIRQRSLTDLNEALQAGGRTGGTAATAGRNRAQNVLIVCEVALALVMLVGANLMVTAFHGVLRQTYGYDANNLLRLQVALESKYAKSVQVTGFYDRSIEKLRRLPGVKEAAVWSDGPDVRVAVEGRPATDSNEAPPSQLEMVSAGFLGAMRVPLVAGRFLTSSDRADTPRVAVLSAVVARRYWQNGDAVGRRIKLGGADGPWTTVVGVAGDIVRDWFNNVPAEEIYVPYQQTPLPWATLVVRTAGDPQTLERAAHDAVRQIDPDLPVYSVQTMDHYLFEQAAGVRAAADSMETYAVVALMLATTGIFGVISFFVVQRTRDIGVHIALGANRRDVLAMTVRQTLIPSLVGVAIGLAGAFFLANLMSSVLYHFVKVDVWTFASCGLGLMGAAFLASYVPARRATRIDPLVALRDG